MSKKPQDRSSWTRQEPGEDYCALVEFRRPCARCGELFSIYVTQRIASGEADTNNFGLRNCEQHRRSRNKPDELSALRVENLRLRAALEAKKMPWDI